jgi:hypothetical protein
MVNVLTITTVSAPLIYYNSYVNVVDDTGNSPYCINSHVNVVGDTGNSPYCIVVVNVIWRI